jgi:type II secretory pathway component GspD/PulD (secretin)
MDFQDVALKDLLKVFSVQTGINFIASEAVQTRSITLYLDKVPVKMAMDELFKANNLSYDYDALSNIIIIKDWGKPQVETVTKVFVLKYATVLSAPMKKEIESKMACAQGGAGAGGGADKESTGISKAVEKMLSEYGKLSEDPRTNSLIITDIPSQFDIIEKTIERLDVSIPQVMLEVEMLDVSKNLVDKMGFEFDNNPITLILPGSFQRRGADFYFGAAADRKDEGGVTMGSTYANTLDLLRTQTDTKYLARPRLLTLNNETAEIKITTNESIGVKITSNSETGTTSIEAERAETGVIFRVTPQVSLGTGEITMFISPQVSEAVQGNTLTYADAAYQFRDPEMRSTTSVVKIKDGETVIVGGLIRNELSQTLKKLPILGDIPLVGALFRHKDKTKDKERELLVFITPHIVKDSRVELASTNSLPERKVLSGSLEREQQLSEVVFHRTRLINDSLNNFER